MGLKFRTNPTSVLPSRQLLVWDQYNCRDTYDVQSFEGNCPRFDDHYVLRVELHRGPIKPVVASRSKQARANSGTISRSTGIGRGLRPERSEPGPQSPSP